MKIDWSSVWACVRCRRSGVSDELRMPFVHLWRQTTCTPWPGIRRMLRSESRWGGGSSFIHPDLRGWSTSATTEAENELWTWRVSLGSKAEHGWLKQADSAASLGLQPPSPANCCDPHSCINYPVQRWQLIKWRLTKERRGIRVIIQHWGKMKSILKMVTAERLNSKLNLSYASGVRFEFQLKW